MTGPQRIQLRRTRGWRKPEGVVVVSRPSRWGNPFTIDAAIETGYCSNGAEARPFVVACFADWLDHGPASDWWFIDGAEQYEWIVEHIAELRGKDLACWCPPGQRCHGDVLLRVANG